LKRTRYMFGLWRHSDLGDIALGQGMSGPFPRSG
jgi:hypothetical protein